MSSRLLTAAAIAALILCALAYLPGISGPYVFDDYSNLLTNDYVKLRTLDLAGLYQSAYSLEAGPLHRPIAMMSFAVNYYFAGGFENSTAFKLTNLAVHVVNSLLIFWLMRLIFGRLAQTASRHGTWIQPGIQASVLLPGIVALLWAVNPIQLTTVLYVVQRMVSLAALFTLLGLICYLKGRERMLAARTGGALLAGVGIVGFGTLGVLSKENAILLLPLVLMLELILFRDEPPLSRWRFLTHRTKRVLTVITFAAVIVTVIWVVLHAAQGYSTRHFTLSERLLTETRVLWLYISLILVPRLDVLSLNHDDIVISTSLLTPWTTLPSLLGILGIIALALATWVRRPLTALGILWFLIGHSLESTVFSLEIAHEHRNYLPSLGVLLVFVDFLDICAHRLEFKRMWIVLPVFAAVFAGVTFLRSLTWSDLDTLIVFEAQHHPDSPRAQIYLGASQARRGDYQAAIETMRLASRLDPYDSVYFLNMHLYSAYLGRPLSAEDKAMTLERLAGKPISASSFLSLDYINNCLLDRCRGLQRDVEIWMRAQLANLPPNADRSFLYYMLGRSLFGQGRTQEALAALQRSYEVDPSYLHPRFETVQILIHTGRLKAAEQALAALRKANERNLHPRDKDIRALTERLTAANTR